MEYNNDNISTLKDVIQNGVASAGKFSFRIFNENNIECEIKMPPPLEIIRAINADDMYNLDIQERLAKYCLMGRRTVVYYNGQEIGNIVINSLDNNWNDYPVLTTYPLALQLIIEVCTAEVIKKSIPPQIVKAE